MASVSKMDVSASLALALGEDPFYRSITVSCTADEERHSILSQYFALAMTEAEGRGEVQRAGSVGAALWITDEIGQAAAGDLSSHRKRELRQLLGPAGFGNYQSICAGMDSKVPDSLDGSWYLSILGVHPDARGQGLAHTLLERTLQRADHLNKSTYLETFNPLSLAFYRRLGFTNKLSLFEELTARPYWLLWRDPRN
ncbi:Acetyltransferase (GNAT) family protein [Janthinobacterium sp. TND4EL3]|uniref:GNAT family N-acetyltransferase n=1 Tax=Janthinobacterium sp. TND4EL3 TaxID=1907311 RepID=UPI000956F50F|nr:GNAT family N-acetyltransferase [Janthinobacterium sp. TND4EL3]SIR87321.1 Acetyltransferase (GNAT) family protein [Janthinobacterium sp. TND4EL3]